MPDRDPPIPAVPDSRAVPKKQTRLSLVWFIPIVAALVGVWVAVARIRSEGPDITILFQSAEGLEAGKTKINYRGVDVGTITAIRLSEDHQRVIATAQMAPRDRGLFGRGHAAVGGAAAHLGGQRDRPGHAHLRGLYRNRNRQLEGAQARLRGAGDAAGGDRQCAGTVLRAEDLRPGFAGYRHAAVLPAAAGRAGRDLHAGLGRQVLHPQGLRARALRSVCHREHAFLAGERNRRVALRYAGSACRPNRCCRS